MAAAGGRVKKAIAPMVAAGVVAAVWAAAGRAAGRAPAPAPARVEIDSPAADSYVSGATTIKAHVAGLAAPTRLLFSVDGRQICAVVVPPFECAWEAGTRVTEHQIRVVAEM